ncbi:MAG: RIP metalloprotease RseP, partial [Cycloclasticus sp.]|nr:RIP metalloprotease RseP [Cycloclasticus sp.]
MTIIIAILSFIVALGILVTIHEFGHFWVARKCGVKVLRFSVGFGKPLFKFNRKDDPTDYVVAGIPLGGYVKMLDENEGNVNEDERHLAFNNKPLLSKFLIVLAGPVANLIFAFIAFWLVLMIGEQGLKPVV